MILPKQISLVFLLGISETIINKFLTVYRYKIILVKCFYCFT